MKKLTALAGRDRRRDCPWSALRSRSRTVSCDGNAHPNVGAFLVQRPTGWSVLCTGSLVAPRVFLTASHCTSFADEQGLTVGVTFQSTDSEHPATVLSGHTVTNPLYHAPYAHDVSVIVLDQAQPGPYVPLPRVGAAGRLEEGRRARRRRLPQRRLRHGTRLSTNRAGKDFPFDGDRWRVGVVVQRAQQGHDSLCIQKDNADEGGTGYGDSGGPTLPERRSDLGRQLG